MGSPAERGQHSCYDREDTGRANGDGESTAFGPPDMCCKGSAFMMELLANIPFRPTASGYLPTPATSELANSVSVLAVTGTK